MGRYAWLAALLLGLTAAAAKDQAPQPRVIAISAKKFEFTPSEIKLKKGEPVILELTALDRTHGFKVPDLGIRVDVTTSAVVRVPVTPLKAGTFDFSCDVFCGMGHEDMTGQIVVEE